MELFISMVSSVRKDATVKFILTLLSDLTEVTTPNNVLLLCNVYMEHVIHWLVIVMVLVHSMIRITTLQMHEGCRLQRKSVSTCFSLQVILIPKGNS